MQSFEETDKKAQELLNQSEKSLHEMEPEIEQMEKELTEHAQEIAKELLDICTKVKLDNVELDINILSEKISEYLHNTPSVLYTYIQESFLEELSKDSGIDINATSITYWLILTTLGENNIREQKEERKDEDESDTEETKEHEPLNVVISEEELTNLEEKVTRNNVGCGLNDGVVLSVESDVGHYAGDGMSGGTLTVEGDARDYAGWDMSGGTLTVVGNAGHSTGWYMSGGTLTVEGNAGDGTGWDMSGGVLAVDGNAGEYAGLDMSGGTLNIQGNVTSFDDSAFSKENKGTIIWKGVTIFENGEKTPEYDTMNVPIFK